MNADAGRRTFVRNMAIGLPALVGSASLPVTALGFAPTIPALGGVIDPDARIDHVLRQIAGFHNEVLRRRPTPADARVVASYLRTLIAYRNEGNRDTELARGMKELVAQKGAARLSHIEPDRQLMVRGLSHYGVGGGVVDFGLPSPQDRLRAIETIVKEGARSFYGFELFATELLAAVEYAESLGVAQDTCKELQQAMTLLEAMAASMCLGAMFLPVLAPECFAATVVLAILKLLNLLLQC